MSRRLRLVRVVVKPELFWDDGDTLEPVSVEPTVVLAADLDGYADNLRAEIAALEERQAESD